MIFGLIKNTVPNTTFYCWR